MRVGAGVVLDGFRGAAVGVAFAEDGVDGAAHDFRVTGLGVLFGVGLGDFGKIGEGVAFGLELGDGGFELRDRGADIGKLNDVGLGLEGQGAELGEAVCYALIGRKEIGEHGEDAGGDGDVAGLDVDAGVLREGLDDRQQGIGGESGGFVSFRVDDRGIR